MTDENNTSETPPLLQVEGLCVSSGDRSGAPREILSNVDFVVNAGEIVGLVGESGSGKSMTALTLMRLLSPGIRVSSGRVVFEGSDLLQQSDEYVRRLRGRRISMIFQEPMTSLNPLLSIGFQISESLRLHLGLPSESARVRAVQLLSDVGIGNASKRYDEYPHSFSGGMRQRALIAMAIACQPQLLIADEPTTALDVTIQAQILDLLLRLRESLGSGMLLITHDMGVIARVSDRVVVMYCGEVFEVAPTRALFSQALHPYSKLLLAAMPSALHKVEQLPVIPGTMPSPSAMPTGCRFHPRCSFAVDLCRQSKPPLRTYAADREARCWRVEELSGEDANG